MSPSNVNEPVKTGRKSRRREQSEFTSYYGRPVLKPSHWGWHIWFYFWIGGIAAGASVITALTELLGDKKRDASIIRAGRYISLISLLISPVLLILDLKRPERFLHMLRIVKLRSPLNLGTYILIFTSLWGGLNTVQQFVNDFPNIVKNKFLRSLAQNSSNQATVTLQGLGGLALGSYTGVLLSATATPLWAEQSEVLGPLFISSSLSTGAAAINLARAVAGVDTKELDRLANIERIAMLSELSWLAYGTFKLKPEVRRFVTSGKHAPFYALAAIEGALGGLVLPLVAPKRGPVGRVFVIINSVLVLAGGFWLRYAIVEAGKASALDPVAYHAITGKDEG